MYQTSYVLEWHRVASMRSYRKDRIPTFCNIEHDTSSPVVIGTSGHAPSAPSVLASRSDTSLQNSANHPAFGGSFPPPPTAGFPELEAEAGDGVPPLHLTNCWPFHPRGRMRSRLFARNAGVKRTIPIVCFQDGIKQNRSEIGIEFSRKR